MIPKRWSLCAVEKLCHSVDEKKLEQQSGKLPEPGEGNRE